MTKQEFVEMQEQLYYGHDVELKISEQHYFVEWSNRGIEIYLVANDSGKKVAFIHGKDRNDTIAKLFDLKIDGNRNINDFYKEIEIVDIE